VIQILELDRVDVCLMGNRSHLRPEHIRDDIPACATRIQSGLQDTGLELSDLFCIPWTDFETFAPNHPDKTERDRAWSLFVDMLELAERVRAPGLTMLPGIAWPGDNFEASFDRAVEELSRRAVEAHKRGLRFSVEPHAGSIAEDPTNAARLCDTVQRLELTLDYSHFVFQGYSEQEIEPLITHTRHLHARGAAHGRMQAPLSENTIDFERMVDALVEAGYQGDIGLEYLWIEWADLNRCDTLSETILLRDRLRARLAGESWTLPVSTI
jgi:sugar phosphate isomerase/epimerase